MWLSHVPVLTIHGILDTLPSNMELLSAMMKQVSLLDMTVRSQTKEIKLKVMLDPLFKT